MAGGVSLYSGFADVMALMCRPMTPAPTASPPTNGFVEHFIRTVNEEFFDVAKRQTFYNLVAALQADLDAWLVHHNTERPHRGYRNMGRRPRETIDAYRTGSLKQAKRGHRTVKNVSLLARPNNHRRKHPIDCRRNLDVGRVDHRVVAGRAADG